MNTIKQLETYNQWRRGADIPQPNPTELGLAIDRVILEHFLLLEYAKELTQASIKAEEKYLRSDDKMKIKIARIKTEKLIKAIELWQDLEEF